MSTLIISVMIFIYVRTCITPDDLYRWEYKWAMRKIKRRNHREC